MNSDEFLIHGKEMVDFIANFWNTLRDRKPLSDVRRGYIRELIPSNPPKYPEDWKTIFNSLEDVVMKGNTNWHHPHFFAYYPTACSYQSIMGDMLSGAIAGVGFNWIAGPSMTELEMATLDWMVDILALPNYFKNLHDGPGCGIIQNSASDATMIAILSARAKACDMIVHNDIPSSWTKHSILLKSIEKIQKKIENTENYDDIIVPLYHNPAIFESLVVYTSEQAHTSVDKAAMLCGMKIRKLKSSVDEFIGNYTVTSEILEKAIQTDRNNGLIPFIYVATIGSTSTCGFDHLDELGSICNKENIWLHVDAAYAGSYLLCPEFRYLSKGIEYVDSYSFNAHKAMMINFDCSPMWFKDGKTAVKYFDIDNAIYLKKKDEDAMSNYRHLQISLGRRFRALKIWFVLRNMGINRIQEKLRKQERQAALFANILLKDDKFELFVPQHLGLVCFRIANSSDNANQQLCEAINSDRRIHIVPSKVCDKFILRFAVCSELTLDEDIQYAYKVIEGIRANMEHTEDNNNKTLEGNSMIQILPKQKNH